MVNRHPVDRGETIVVSEVKKDDMEYQWCMRRPDLMLGTKIDWYAILPFLQLMIELSDSIEKLSVGLLCSLSRVQLLVDLALDGCKFAHKAEQIDLALSISKGDISNVVIRVRAWEINIHIIVVLRRRSSRPQADVFVQHVSDPK